MEQMNQIALYGNISTQPNEDQSPLDILSYVIAQL